MSIKLCAPWICAEPSAQQRRTHLYIRICVVKSDCVVTKASRSERGNPEICGSHMWFDDIIGILKAEKFINLNFIWWKGLTTALRFSLYFAKAIWRKLVMVNGQIFRAYVQRIV